jgi:transposase
MRRALPKVHESLEALTQLLTGTKDAKRKRRVHLLVLIASGEVRSRAAAAKHLGLHRNSIGDWLAEYEACGLEGLLEIGKPGVKPGQKVLKPAVLKALEERLAGEGFDSYGQVRQWLEREFAVEIPYGTVYGLVRFRLASKLKRPRPQHVKKTPPTPLPSPGG